MYKNDTREIKGYVEIVNENIDNCKNNAVVNGNENTFSDMNQVVDSNRTVYDYAILLDDYIDLEKGMMLPNLNNKNSVGWISNELVPRDLDGTTRNNYLEVTLNSAVTCNGLTIYFEKGIATDFKLVLTYSDGSEKTKDIKNTDKVFYLLEKQTNLKKVYIQVNTWESDSGSERAYPIISEIDFDISFVFENDELIEFEVVEQVSKLCFEIPTNTTTVKIPNYDKKFDYINKSGLSSYLKENMLIKPFIGIVTEDSGIEYTDMGIFYLTSWYNNDDSTTNFNGENIISTLSKEKSHYRKWRYDSYNPNASFIGSEKTYDYFKNMCNEWGIPYESPDETLNTCSDKALPLGTRLEQLQQLAVVGCALTYGNRNNKLLWKNLPTNILDTIPLDIMQEKPKINVKTPIGKITIISQISYSSEDESAINIYGQSISIEGTKDIVVPFDTPVASPYYSVTLDNGTLNRRIEADRFGKFNISANGIVTLNISAKKEELNVSEYQEIINESSNLNIEVSSYMLHTNPSLRIPNIINNIKNNYGQYDIEFNWKQDPRITAGSLIQIETDFGYKTMFVEQQIFKFDGSLSGSTKGVSN
ncbi:MAG: hypothetical protein IJO32_00660 [Bacilli bacterium]|nr:hypothetical protein [Bacilli bacterium]